MAAMLFSLLQLASLSLLTLHVCHCALTRPAVTERLSELAFDLVGKDIHNELDGRDPVHLAGYFKLNRTYDAHMFYLYFEDRNMAPDSPLVLWMTGGPGCSSELAVFYENGPYHINDDLSLEPSAFGWDIGHNMVYVDQPINTGFSWSEDPRDKVSDEVGVAADMLDFLTEFLEAHPELADRDFYITGESYGGHYVPAVAYRVFLANKRGELEKPFNLKGFAIGNGLTNPEIQYGAYADFAFSSGLISEEFRDLVLQSFPACKQAIRLCNTLAWASECVLASDYCGSTQFDAIRAVVGNINVYDIRLPCKGALCYDLHLLDDYLDQESVRAALGVGNRTWEECNMELYQDFAADFMKDFSSVIPPMLEDGIRVLIYAGDQDFICNWLGNKRWVVDLDWSGKEALDSAAEVDWLVAGQLAGSFISSGPLSFLRVSQAGHLVPMDQPEAALDMITHFTGNLPLTPRLVEEQALAE